MPTDLAGLARRFAVLHFYEEKSKDGLTLVSLVPGAWMVSIDGDNYDRGMRKCDRALYSATELATSGSDTDMMSRSIFKTMSKAQARSPLTKRFGANSSDEDIDELEPPPKKQKIIIKKIRRLTRIPESSESEEENLDLHGEGSECMKTPSGRRQGHSKDQVTPLDSPEDSRGIFRIINNQPPQKSSRPINFDANKNDVELSKSALEVSPKSHFSGKPLYLTPNTRLGLKKLCEEKENNLKILRKKITNPELEAIVDYLDAKIDYKTEVIQHNLGSAKNSISYDMKLKLDRLNDIVATDVLQAGKAFTSPLDI